MTTKYSEERTASGVWAARTIGECDWMAAASPNGFWAVGPEEPAVKYPEKEMEMLKTSGWRRVSIGAQKPPADIPMMPRARESAMVLQPLSTNSTTVCEMYVSNHWLPSYMSAHSVSPYGEPTESINTTMVAGISPESIMVSSVDTTLVPLPQRGNPVGASYNTGYRRSPEVP